MHNALSSTARTTLDNVKPVIRLLRKMTNKLGGNPSLAPDVQALIRRLQLENRGPGTTLEQAGAQPYK